MPLKKGLEAHVAMVVADKFVKFDFILRVVELKHTELEEEILGAIQTRCYSDSACDTFHCICELFGLEMPHFLRILLLRFRLFSLLFSLKLA